MKRKEVVSTNIVSIGYDETVNTLEIEYKAGSIYAYYQVPQNLHQELLESTSFGRFLDREIKEKFNSKKIK